MNIQAELIRIVAEQAMVDTSTISAETTLEDLGLDSLAVVECVFDIEETFNIQVPFNANNPEDSSFDISSIGAMTKAVEALIAKKDS